MTRFIQHQADVLFDIAQKNDWLEECYILARKYHSGIPLKDIEIPDKIILFPEYIPDNHQKQVMDLFLSHLMDELKIVKVYVSSAVELTDDQLTRLEKKLVKTIHKQVGIHNIVDTSIIGGLKILVGNTIIDNSIKSQLGKLKDDMYKGVFFEID